MPYSVFSNKKPDKIKTHFMSNNVLLQQLKSTNNLHCAIKQLY